MRLIQAFCCSLLVIGSSCQGPSVPDTETARSLYQEAISLDPQDDADRIMDLCRQLDPDFPWGYLGLGELLEDRRSFEEAAMNYQRVLETDPKSELGHERVARVYGLMGRREDEIAAYRTMISELPDAAGGYWGLMRAYRKAERESEAASLLQQIYARFKTDPDEGALALSQIADSVEDPSEKARLWVRFIEDYPKGPNIVNVMTAS